MACGMGYPQWVIHWDNRCYDMLGYEPRLFR